MLLKGLLIIFLNGRIQPFFADILTSLLFHNFIPFQIHLNKPIFLKSSDLNQSLEYFDVTEQCDFIEGKIEVLNLSQINQVIGKLRDDVIADIDELKRGYGTDIFDFADLIMRQVQYLQILGRYYVCRHGADITKAKIELAYAFR